MRILVVAATRLEIPDLHSGSRGVHELDVLVTGVGMVAMAAHCSRALAGRAYDLALNLGLCGSFTPELPLGTVVHVVDDRLSELGAEDGDRFLSIEELGLGQSSLINHAPPDIAPLNELPRVRAITVNTVHGADASIVAVQQRCAPEVESMEGAAFAYTCRMANVRYAQVRAVSNRVERRNRESWAIDLAIRHLNDVASRLLDYTCA
jgi:futalosine hydrolase